MTPPAKSTKDKSEYEVPTTPVSPPPGESVGDKRSDQSTRLSEEHKLPTTTTVSPPQQSSSAPMQPLPAGDIRMTNRDTESSTEENQQPEVCLADNLQVSLHYYTASCNLHYIYGLIYVG